MPNIEKLTSGQTPSLLQASKGNELIDAINHLTNSKSTVNADIGGITLKSTAEGSLELDVSEATANALNNLTQSGGIPSGFVEQRVNAVSNGQSQGVIILVKNV